MWNDLMKEYIFDREEFCSIVLSIMSLEEIYEAFSNGIIITDDFMWFVHNESYYIIHLDSGTIVNWYKHLGRCNASNKTLSKEELREFFLMFKKEVNYM